MEKRDSTIDLLRVLGTFLVILAHVKIPKVMSEIRTFDVVLLVFISGMSLKYAKHKHYFDYIKKRIKKLLIPAWTTVSVILLCLFIGDKIVGPFSILNWKYVTHSYLLIDSGSIGAVWIVKVYLLIALLTPVIDYLEKKIDSSIILIGSGYLVIVIFNYLSLITMKYLFIQEYIIYAVQYSIIALMGLRFVKRKKSGIIICVISIIVLLNSVIVTGSFEPSAFKYPPQTYYLSYGLLCSVILYYLLDNLKKYKISENNVIIWLSTHSFSIYINHIYYLWLFFVFGKIGIRLNYVLEYLILILSSILQTMILEYLKNKKYNQLIIEFCNNKWLKK